MKKHLYIFLILLFPVFVFSQNVEVEGGFIEYSIDVSSGVIKNVADPISAQDAATKAYVDALESQVSVMNNILQDTGYNGTLSDVEGNVYKTIKIGDQIWMADNLRVTKYNEGTPIPEVTDGTAWENLNTPGYCWYDTTGTNYATYSQDTFGAMYNYYVVADTNSLNVCPVGWHVPTDGEWTTLTDYLGGTGIGGGKMKEAGLAHWNSQNTGATNESGFAGLPGGFRFNFGYFDNIGSSGFWWSSTEFNTSNAWYRYLLFLNVNVNSIYNNKGSGLSVRCLRD